MKIVVIAAMALTVAGSARAAEYSPEVERHIKAVENGLVKKVIIEGDKHSRRGLAERMAALHVPGFSIAVEHQGYIEWAKGYGEARPGVPVNTETLFQAGSISKPLAAMAALRLVEQGKLSLDADINASLTRWKLPTSDMSKGKTVTLRELLTHTGGTTIHGFPGYAEGEAVPSPVQVLDGAAPANTKAVRIEAEPGTNWNYSGGGFTIVQLAMSDATGQAFPALLHDTVLAPIGMTRSTYEQPLPASLKANAAVPYDSDGHPVKGGPHTYPEMAAAGLWTTPSELARYAIEVQQSLAGKANHVLSESMTTQMLTPGLGQWGLGLEMGGRSTNPTFGHDGANAGFRNVMLAFEHGGDGVFIMTNGDNGIDLAYEVLRAVAGEYHWPDNHPVEKRAVKVDASVLASYAGTYDLSQTISIEFRVENGQLIAHPAKQAPFALWAASETRFFPEINDSDLEFFKPADGQPAYVVLHQNGADRKGIRK